MKIINSIPTLFISLLMFVFLSCTQSDEQREFERDALSLPENITETGDNGAIIDDNSDPDDWRVGPFFQGVISIDPPFPNPLLSNQRLTLNVYVTGVDGVSGLRLFVLYQESNLRLLYEDFRSPLPTGSNAISIDALDIARFNENAPGLYRIILEDWDRNIISYGDVRIE